MINKCAICGRGTIVFIWSTSRVIDKKKLVALDQFKKVANLGWIGFPICWACIKEHGLIISSKETENEQ